MPVEHAIKNYDHDREFIQAGGNLIFVADCPTERAAFMTDMTLGRGAMHLHFNLSAWLPTCQIV